MQLTVEPSLKLFLDILISIWKFGVSLLSQFMFHLPRLNVGISPGTLPCQRPRACVDEPVKVLGMGWLWLQPIGINALTAWMNEALQCALYNCQS